MWHSRVSPTREYGFAISRSGHGKAQYSSGCDWVNSGRLGGIQFSSTGVDATSVTVSSALGNFLTAFASLVCGCDWAFSGALTDSCDWPSDLSTAMASLCESMARVRTVGDTSSLTIESSHLLWRGQLLSVTGRPNLRLRVEVWLSPLSVEELACMAAEFLQELDEESVFIDATCSTEMSASFSWPCSTWEMLTDPSRLYANPRSCWGWPTVTLCVSWTASMLWFDVCLHWALIPLLRAGSWSIGEHVSSVSGELQSTVVLSWSDELLEW